MDSDFIRGVVRLFGGVVVLMSVNISSYVSIVRIEEFEYLWFYCVFIFDVGIFFGGWVGLIIVDFM